jgi:hypothetical protein
MHQTFVPVRDISDARAARQAALEKQKRNWRGDREKPHMRPRHPTKLELKTPSAKRAKRKPTMPRSMASSKIEVRPKVPDPDPPTIANVSGTAEKNPADPFSDFVPKKLCAFVAARPRRRRGQFPTTRNMSPWSPSSPFEEDEEASTRPSRPRSGGDGRPSKSPSVTGRLDGSAR